MPETEESIETGLFACTIVSLCPYPITEYKPGLIPGFYDLPKSDTITPQVLVVKEAKHFVYLDSGRGSLPVLSAPEKVANSIVRDYIDGQMGATDTAKPAVFFVPGALTANQVIKRYSPQIELYLQWQKNWLHALVKQADDDWNRYHAHKYISDNQRVALSLLGLSASSHPWASLESAINSEKCLGCLTQLQTGQKICHQCKMIQHLSTADKFVFAGQ